MQRGSKNSEWCRSESNFVKRDSYARFKKMINHLVAMATAIAERDKGVLVEGAKA